uniref:NACHT domain-containing protein n=2 Tax=Oncorhynchus kisutch TaxID=8019 RepID=A0A8C7IBH7_ONCKI
MASTQQSAFEYVQNGRALLEGHLQKPSLVVNELRKNNIFSEKQVREIKSHKNRSVKTRKMLDMIIKKGEYASYELLKILYNTRNQTLPRTNPTQNQPRHPDLHQWISCFSFTDDPDLQSGLVSESGPCERYKRQLRTKAVEFLHAKWDQHMHFLKDKAKCKPFTYIPVVLDTDSSELSKTKSKYKKARSKKLKTYIPRDKGKLSPGHLLESSEKKILLVGKPGIGKTTVVQQVLNIWAENENPQESYMFYFDEPSMRSMSHSSQPSSLRSLLFERYLKPEEGTEDVVLCDIQNNSENVIFVFDGIMDVIGNPVLNNILAKELLCDAKILTTCRPEAEDCEFLSDWPSYRVEVQGFNNESIHAYLKWRLGTEDDYVCSVASNDALFSLCHVPMYAFIVTACISFSPCEAKNHPCTITEMYVRIFRHCMKRHGDQNVEYLDKYIHDNMGNIKFLAINSFQALLAKTVNLTEMDCKDNSVQHAFLTSNAAKESSTGHSFAFLHNTMQEFWAALFLLMTPGNITSVLQQCQTEEGKYLKYIVSFLCGLLSSDIAELINCVVPEDQIREISDIYLEKVIDSFLGPAILQGHDESHTELDADLLFVCQCLYEHQSPEACSLLLQKVEYELDLSGQYLDPQQCCAVSYVINQSTNKNVCLYLIDCTFSDPGLRMILGSLKNLQCLR